MARCARGATQHRAAPRGSAASRIAARRLRCPPPRRGPPGRTCRRDVARQSQRRPSSLAARARTDCRPCSRSTPDRMCLPAAVRAPAGRRPASAREGAPAGWPRPRDAPSCACAAARGRPALSREAACELIGATRAHARRGAGSRRVRRSRSRGTRSLSRRSSTPPLPRSPVTSPRVATASTRVGSRIAVNADLPASTSLDSAWGSIGDFREKIPPYRPLHPK